MIRPITRSYFPATSVTKVLPKKNNGLNKALINNTNITEQNVKKNIKFDIFEYPELFY